MSGIVRIPRAGEIISGQFRLGPEVGRGAFGIVFEARQLDLDRRVAVKMLHPRALASPNIAERFKREARLVSALSHPHTVALYAFGEYGSAHDVAGLPYMVMEYLEGEDLHDFLVTHGRVTVEEAISILIQALGSLAEAHGKGIIHRDLKPENLFIARQPDGENVIKILDFGIAKAINDDGELQGGRSLTGHGAVCGTPQYMAPEQATGERNLTPAADIYAIGCIAFELVTGSPPFTGRSPMDIALKHLSNPVPELPPEIADSPIAAVIQRALAKDPTERYSDAAELEAELLELAPLDLAPIPTPTIPALRSMDVGPGQPLPSLELEETTQLSGEASTVMFDLETMERKGRNAPPRGETSILQPALDPGALEAPRRSNVPILLMIGLGAILLAGAIIAALGLAVGTSGRPSTTPTPDPAPTILAEEVTVTILTTPEGASVFADDAKLGETPLLLKRPASAQALAVTIGKEGYQKASREIDLGSNHTVQVDLDPISEPSHDDAIAAKDVAPGDAKAPPRDGADNGGGGSSPKETVQPRNVQRRRVQGQQQQQQQRRRAGSGTKIELWN